MEYDHNELRVSFLTPIPEVEAAADLLALAVDNLLAGNDTLARSYLEKANMPLLRAYTRSIASQVTPEIHRLRDVAGLPAIVPMSERGRRQPDPTTKLVIFRRDGFRCRYCGCRIIFPETESVISAIAPGAVRWGTKDSELNAAFFTLKGVLDHVDPHAHGGASHLENLVVACQPCNYGKGNFFIQQLGLSDPRLRPPQVDSWDGLLRVLQLRPRKLKTMELAAGLGSGDAKLPRAIRLSPLLKSPASIDEFASTFSVSDRRHLDALLQVVEECRNVGVSWTLNRVLLVKIRVEDIELNVLGIDRDTAVEVPWSIGPHKQVFRTFVKILALGMPDSTIYETEKMWRVRCHGRTPRLSELMQGAEALQAAFQALHFALTPPASTS